MTTHLLVASHHSSAFSTPVEFAVSSQARRSTSRPAHSQSVSLLNDHALYASVRRMEGAGDFLLRVVQGGLQLELTLLDWDKGRPIRYKFPDKILPTPSLILGPTGEALVYVVTTAGSLYQLSFPLTEPYFHTPPAADWCKERQISHSIHRPISGFVVVHDDGSIVLTIPSGGILRLDAEHEWHYRDDPWKEKTQYPPHAGLLSKVFRSGHHGEEEIISLAAAPTNNLTFSISRDRVLRVWDRHRGNIHFSKVPAFSGQEELPRGSVPPGSTSSQLQPLGPERRNLIHIFQYTFDMDEDVSELASLRILVFMPTPLSPDSGGLFLIYRLPNDASQGLILLQEKAASSRTIRCELRDFMVLNGTLHSIWEDQEETLYQSTMLDFEEDEFNDWSEARYLDIGVLSPEFTSGIQFEGESAPEELLDAVLRPGAFSPYTIQSALDQYADALRSLPDPPFKALARRYHSLRARLAGLVGCTVKVTDDPFTGIEMWQSYYNALRRDWEGFLARCRDIERAARWPIALGVVNGTPAVIERERMGILVEDDAPLHLYRKLTLQRATTIATIENVENFIDLAFEFKSFLEPMSWQIVEHYLYDRLQKDIDVSYHRVLLQLAEDVNLGEMDEGTRQAVLSIADTIGSTALLDEILAEVAQLVRHLGEKVKLEDDEYLPGAMDIPTDFHTRWTRSLTAAYLGASLNARYEIVTAVLFLLMHLEYSNYKFSSYITPNLLDQLFAAFRSIFVLRRVASHVTTGQHARLTDHSGREGTDEVLSERLQDMGVNNLSFSASQSVIQVLLEPLSLPFSLPYASNAFLRANGILKSESALISCDSEAAFVERLRVSAFSSVAAELVNCFPKTAAICYVSGRIRLENGDLDEAADLFERVSRNFGPLASTNGVEIAALRSVLPPSLADMSSLSLYYRHVSELFTPGSHFPIIASFCRLAIDASEPGQSTQDLWHTVFRCQIATSSFEDAYMTLVITPYSELRNDAVMQLVESMCENNQVELLLRFNFVGFSNQLERALMSKLQSEDPLSKPDYAQILFAYYVQKGDYRNAATTMYHQALRLGQLSMETSENRLLIWDLQGTAYAMAVNTLSLLDARNAWISITLTPANRRLYNQNFRGSLIPEDQFTNNSLEAEIIELPDMRKEYELCRCRNELARLKEATHGDRDVSEFATISGLQAVNAFAMKGMYERAISAAVVLQEDMTTVLVGLAELCIQFSHASDDEMPHIHAMFTQKVASWEGSMAQKTWKLLQQSLDRYDSAENGWGYRKACFERLLDKDPASTPPTWLTAFFQDCDPEYLIRTCLRYNLVLLAIDQTLIMIQKANAPFDKASTQVTTQTHLSYPLIDAVVAAANSEEEVRRAASIKAEIGERMGRVSKWG